MLSQENTQLASLLMNTQTAVLVSILLFLVIIPVELFALHITIDLLKNYKGLRIEETIKFNQFKFKRVKFRWMNDVFAHSQDIRHEFREYEKFAFSSQLYFIISLIAIGLQLSFLGAIAMIQAGYLPFNDPVTYPLFVIVWVICEVLSVAVSFLAVKFKLY